MYSSRPKNKSQPNRLLLVDDDEVFRDALKKALEDGGFAVTAASNLKQSRELIGVESFDAVISDICMPGGSGIELTHFIRRTVQGLPVVLMTGYSEFKDTQETKELGVDHFLAKPFRREELINTLKSCLALEDEPLNLDDQFCKVGIDDFVSGREMQYDVYIRLSQEKYVKIAHKGESVPIERIRAYKSKSINFLYLTREDFKRYMGLNMTLANAVRQNNGIPKARKLAFLRHTSELVVEHLHLNEITEEDFEGARAILDTTVSTLSSDNDFLTLLEALNSSSDHLYAHSLGVSLYSVMVARALGWNSPPNIYKLAMGGLLHDIGKKELDPEILNKPRQMLNAEEVKQYESHPTRGMEILGRIPTIPSDVLQIVGQHHENCLGLGFPLNLSRNKIHPMARVVAAVDEFCALALKGPLTEPLPPDQALMRMIAMNPGRFDPNVFAALARLFKCALPDSNRKSATSNWK